jgi:hypothetical protein
LPGLISSGAGTAAVQQAEGNSCVYQEVLSQSLGLVIGIALPFQSELNDFIAGPAQLATSGFNEGEAL